MGKIPLEAVMFLVIQALIFSLILNLSMIVLSKRFGLFIDLDTSNKPQRFHTSPTPRAGGIGIFSPFLFSLSLWNFFHTDPLILAFLVGGGIVFLSGIIEDFNASLSPKIRLLLQCLGSASFVLISGNYLSDLGFGIILPNYIAIPFSIFAIVGITNAINIIDGFNGLASGIALVALICIYKTIPDSALSLLTLVLIGSIAGFFVLNFPWGKIFLGDGGAYFLGFILAGLLVSITQNPNIYGKISPWFGIALLIYPFWEVIFSICRRRKSSLKADNLHLHQILYSKISNNPLTAFLLLLLNLPFMFFSLLFYKNQIILLSLSLLFVLGYLFLYKTLLKSCS